MVHYQVAGRQEFSELMLALALRQVLIFGYNVAFDE